MLTVSGRAGRMMIAAVAGILVGGVALASDLQESVSAKLRSEKSLAEFPIGFEISGATVRLAGEVKTLEQKEKAARIVAKVEGVAGVVNAIEVAASQDKELQIRKRVGEAILYYPYYTMFDSIEVGVDQGTAYLKGFVTQPWKKNEMEKRVKKVEGVRAIENRIEVLPVSSFDDQLRYRILRLLARDGRFIELANRYPAPVHFVVNHARITLEGVVVSDVDRRVLESLVRQNTLALSVTNQLKTDREVRESETD